MTEWCISRHARAFVLGIPAAYVKYRHAEMSLLDIPAAYVKCRHAEVFVLGIPANLPFYKKYILILRMTLCSTDKKPRPKAGFYLCKTD